MIVTETYELNGRQFTRTYSSVGRYVVRDGVSYSEANDPSEFNRVYEEGEMMEDAGEVLSSEAQEILDILLGGAE